MKNSIDQKTGNAEIKKVGHTASSQFGTNPNAQPKGKSAPHDLEVPAKG